MPTKSFSSRRKIEGSLESKYGAPVGWARAMVAGAILLGSSAAWSSTNQFRGVNWADTRDNFQTGVLYLCGLGASDTYASASVVTDRVVGQFVSKLGTNAIRLPINEATASSYWSTYTGVIDMALTKGRVVLCYWGPAHGAAPADMTKWWAMWTTVVNKYGTNKDFYIEIYNEPNMYSKTDLLNLYASWLQKFPAFPQGRVILDGTSMAQNVPDVGSDSRFNNCLLAVHEYTMFGNSAWTTEAQWTSHFKGYVGNYADRTVATEWGGPMSTGSKNGITYQPMNYNVPGTNFFEAYMRSITTQLLAWKMGGFYWAGLKDGDWYSMTTRSGSGASTNLTVSNQSGLDRMKYSWADTVATQVEPQRASSSAAKLKVFSGAEVLGIGFTATGDGWTTARVVDLEGDVVDVHSWQTTGGTSYSRAIGSSGLRRGVYVVSLEEAGGMVATTKVLLGR